MAFNCKLPWQAAQLTHNSINPCCNFTWTQSPPTTFEQYVNNEELHFARQQLSQGTAPPQCVKCQTEESISRHSHRTMSNRFENNDPVNEFEDVSILVSNTCNLKCTSCVSGSSFVRGLEMQKLGLIKTAPPHYTHIPGLELLSNYKIRTLTLLGGEPFVDATRDLLDMLIAADRARDIDLRLNSNCTMITPEWLEYLNNNFKSTLIKASVDGIGPVNDYLRYPSHWADIESNIAMFKNYSNITMPVVTSVLSNLSVIKFYQVIEWCVENNIPDLMVLTARQPRFMAANVLPQQLKQQLLPVYQDLKEKYKHCEPRILESINVCIGICQSSAANVDFADAVEWFQLHDRLRGNNLFEIFPELEPYAKA